MWTIDLIRSGIQALVDTAEITASPQGSVLRCGSNRQQAHEVGNVLQMCHWLFDDGSALSRVVPVDLLRVRSLLHALDEWQPSAVDVAPDEATRNLLRSQTGAWETTLQSAVDSGDDRPRPVARAG